MSARTKDFMQLTTKLCSVNQLVWVLGIMSMALSACLPQDKAVPATLNPTGPSSGSSTFSGATSAQTLSDTKVQVSWTASSDSAVVAYNIYDTRLMFSPRLLATVRAPASQVSLTGLSPQTLYSFRVRAAYSQTSEDSNTHDVQAITYNGITGATVQSSTSALVTFNDGRNADQIQIYCQTTSNPTWTLMQAVTNINLTQYLLTGLTGGVQYTCRAALSINGFVDNNPATTSFMPMGTASQLVFTTQPGNGQAGQQLGAQPVVKIQDSNGNIVSAGPDSTAIITLTLATASPSGGTLRGTAAVAAVNGVATFTNLYMQEAGTKVITASKPDTSAQTFGSAALTADSNSFVISAGTVSPTTSTIAISPAVPPNAALVANGSNAYTVTITLMDQYNNPIVGVRPTFTSNISGDSLTQPAISTGATGQATGQISSTFADTSAPFRSLSINSPSGLSSVTTLAPFVPGTATKLAFSVQPTTSPAGIGNLANFSVAVQDAQGNVVVSGAQASAAITVSIASNVNGAVLSGTLTANAVNGVASFSGLGIDKTATGYKLTASSGSLVPAYSNNFNITAGTPKKITVSGATTFLSGTCSNAYTIQLQDLGGNSANAVSNTPVALSGLGSASLYASSSCSGVALGSTLTFTAGTNTKTVYARDYSAETIVITARDTSNVLTTGTLSVNVAPDKISLLAQMPLPATPGTPMTVVAGQCSGPIQITTAGDTGTPGPLFAVTPVMMSGILGSSANLYSESSCTLPLTATNFNLQPSVGANYTTLVYLKDNSAEVLSLSIADLSGVMTTTSALQVVTVLPSNINFTGPTSVVAGRCSTAFTVTLKDAAGAAVAALANTTLNIQGLGGSSTGAFYTSSGCTGAPNTSTITIPQNSSSVQVYFKDIAAETLALYLSDPAGSMANSQTINLGVSPSTLSVTTPAPANANTTACAGPFTVATLDGIGNPTNAITPITVNLSGGGTSGTFFSDSVCSSSITQLSFTAGVGSKNFYFVGQYPGVLTLVAADNAAVLTQGSANFTIKASKGWIGTAGTNLDSFGNLNWFQVGNVPVSGRIDAAAGPTAVHFDSTKQYMYIADNAAHRLLKYDYTNKQYIGWLGEYNSRGAIGITGSNLSTPSSPACIATVGGATTPGWCTGGQVQFDALVTNGSPSDPQFIADDGTYVYVTLRGPSVVARYNAQTGAYAGWIGRVYTTPTGAGPGGPGTCTSTASGNPTPGWCTGGVQYCTYVNQPCQNMASNPLTGNGVLYNPRAIAYAGGYLYVGTTGAIMRYSTSDGSFQGWIGMVGASSPTGGTGCVGKPSNTLTPGWCTGGAFQAINPKNLGGGGINDPTGLYIIGNTLYVVHTDSGGTINTYNLTTGAYLGWLSNLSFNWSSPYSMTTDGTYLYFADWTRVVKTDSTGLVQGWFGKVNNNASMSGNAGCSTLVPNANTPGWCLGGSSKHGMDEQALHNVQGIDYDGAGNLVTAQGANFPAIKIWNVSSGVYGGTLGMAGSSPTQWSDANKFAQYQGFDDYSFSSPEGVYNDGTYLYTVEQVAQRIKKINMKTGALIGWIGGITTSPTGGLSGCVGSNPMGPAPTWCLGSIFNPNYMWNVMVGQTTDGIGQGITNITGDGTYLYTTDVALHRIQKWRISDGAFMGWIGRISSSPTAGDPGCNGATVNNFTPGWCKGGISQSGSGDGMMNNPGGIVYLSGNLYVVDSSNHRVLSFSATTGAFNGWIGRVNAAPTSNCSTGSNGQYTVSTSGWCLGGTTQASGAGDRGGAFNFTDTGWNAKDGITTDGTFLYIANPGNYRIDKYDTSGVYQGSSVTRYDLYTNTWSNNPAVVTTWTGYNCSYPRAIWTDGTNMYGSMNCSCGVCGHAVWKMNLSSGTMVGWHGAIWPSNSPTAGDTGCAGATTVTPGWCQNGRSGWGYTMGQFGTVPQGITGDANYIYVSDDNNHRVTRIPK